MEFGDYGTIMSGNPFLDMTPEAEGFAGEVYEKMRGEQDPGKRMRILLESINDFYGASWTGTINVDLSLGIWTPMYWYDPDNGHMGPTLFNDYEYSHDFNRWVEALNNTGRLFTLDVSKIEKDFPVEYAHYKRMEADEVFAVPFDGTRKGFLIVRNPTRNEDSRKLLEFLVYIISGELGKLWRISQAHHYLKPHGIEKDNDMIINFFGGLEIHTMHGSIDSGSLEKTMIGKILTFLWFRKNHSANAITIAEHIFDEEDGDPYELSKRIRQYIYHFRDDHGAVFNGEHLILTEPGGGYRLNPYYHIMTDVDQFDNLREQLRKFSSPEKQIHIMKGICKVYAGRMLGGRCDDYWLKAEETEYHRRYIDTLNRLCELLYTKNDYSTISKYCLKALATDAYDHRIYHWLIISMYMAEDWKSCRHFYRMARKKLGEEYFEKLHEDMLMRHDFDGKAVFGKTDA